MRDPGALRSYPSRDRKIERMVTHTSVWLSPRRTLMIEAAPHTRPAGKARVAGQPYRCRRTATWRTDLRNAASAHERSTTGAMARPEVLREALLPSSTRKGYSPSRRLPSAMRARDRGRRASRCPARHRGQVVSPSGAAGSSATDIRVRALGSADDRIAGCATGRPGAPAGLSPSYGSSANGSARLSLLGSGPPRPAVPRCGAPAPSAGSRSR
jgi:hypothetical protein